MTTMSAVKAARPDMFSGESAESHDENFLTSSSNFWLQPVVRGTSCQPSASLSNLNKRRSVAMPIKSDQRSGRGVVPSDPNILTVATDMSRLPRKSTEDFGFKVSLVEIVGGFEKFSPKVTRHSTTDISQLHCRSPSGDDETSRQSRYSLRDLLVQKKLLQPDSVFVNTCNDSPWHFKGESSSDDCRGSLELRGHCSSSGLSDTIPAGAPKSLNLATVSCDLLGSSHAKEAIDVYYALPDQPRERSSVSIRDDTVAIDDSLAVSHAASSDLESCNIGFDGHCDSDMDKTKHESRDIGRIPLCRMTMLNTWKSSVFEIVASSTKTLKNKSRRATIHLASINRLVEFGKRRSSAASEQFPQQFVGPLCAIYPAGVIIRPSRIDPDAWRISMGASMDDWPRQPAEVSGAIMQQLPRLFPILTLFLSMLVDVRQYEDTARCIKCCSLRVVDISRVLTESRICCNRCMSTGFATFWQACLSFAKLLQDCFDALHDLVERGDCDRRRRFLQKRMFVDVTRGIGILLNALGFSWELDHARNLGQLKESKRQQINENGLQFMYRLVKKRLWYIWDVLQEIIENKVINLEVLALLQRKYDAAMGSLQETSRFSLEEALFTYRSNLNDQTISFINRDINRTGEADFEDTLGMIAGETPSSQRVLRFAAMGYSELKTRTHVQARAYIHAERIRKPLEEIIAKAKLADANLAPIASGGLMAPFRRMTRMSASSNAISSLAETFSDV